MLTTTGIILIIVAFVAGAFVGVLLGRRSARANEYTDQLMARLKAAEAKLKSYQQGL